MLRIEYERRVRRWSVLDLAAKAGCSAPVVSTTEHGVFTPGDALLERLGNVLNVTPASVLLRPVAIQADPEEHAAALDAAAAGQ